MRPSPAQPSSPSRSAPSSPSRSSAGQPTYSPPSSSASSGARVEYRPAAPRGEATAPGRPSSGLAGGTDAPPRGGFSGPSGVGTSLGTSARAPVRFPAPYRPAGATRGLSDGAGPSDRPSTSVDRYRDGLRARRVGSFPAPKTVGPATTSPTRGGTHAAPGATIRPSGAYTGAADRPSPTRASTDTATPGGPATPGGTAGGPRIVTRKLGKVGTGATGGGSGSVRGGTRGLAGVAELQATDPKKGGAIRGGGLGLAAAQRASLSAVVGAGGGVIGTPHSGYGYDHGYKDSSDNFCYYWPWGYGFYGSHFSFTVGFGYPYGWYYPCYSWWWPFYTACYYPYWYVAHRPYYYDYYDYPSAYYTTVVYRTLYETVPADDGGYAEPTGEAVAPAAPAAQLPIPESTSIAAQRYVTLGDQAFRDGRYRDAVQLYAKAIEFAPQEGAIHLVLADALFAAGDYHYGAYAIRRAAELEPSLLSSSVDKHAFYADPGEFDRQLAVLEQYLQTHPTDSDARLVLALNYLFGGRPAAAVDLLNLAESTSLRTELAGGLILEAAKQAQYGVPAAPPPVGPGEGG